MFLNTVLRPVTLQHISGRTIKADVKGGGEKVGNL